MQQNSTTDFKSSRYLCMSPSHHLKSHSVLLQLSVNVALSMQAVIYTFLIFLLLKRKHSACINILGHPSPIPKVITELSCSAVLTHYSVQHKKKC